MVVEPGDGIEERRGVALIRAAAGLGEVVRYHRGAELTHGAARVDPGRERLEGAFGNTAVVDHPATSRDKPIEATSVPKRGGVLRVFHYDSPASMSIHEEAFNSAENPMMAVFNNLVVFRQDVPQNRIDTIEPDLATKWSWNADMTALTFQLRQGVS